LGATPTTAAPASTTPAASSFGNFATSTPAGTTGTAATTGGFSTPATSTTGTTASTTGTPSTIPGTALSTVAAPAPGSITTKDPASVLKGKSLDEIFNQWAGQLETDMHTFVKTAQTISEWDMRVNENQDRIAQLKLNVDKLDAAQTELDQTLDLLSAQQNELDQVLTQMETQVEQWSISTDQQALDRERAQSYALAETINRDLDNMGSVLRDLVARLNASQEQNDTNSPAFQIVQILNAHLDSLMWIEQSSQKVQQMIGDAQRKLSESR
jgi:nuclear pore complex protein Nup62